MQWEAAPLFATPVFKLKNPLAGDALRLFEEVVRPALQDADTDERGALRHHHSRRSVFEAHPETLAPLRASLEEQASFVYRELMHYRASGPLSVTQAWFNEAGIGASQPPHAHTNCLLSGTLYLRADEATGLTFHHPAAAPSQHAEIHDVPAPGPNPHGLRFHLREARVAARAGDCLFWPSALRHGYTDNRTPDRLTLSFNLMPRRLNIDYQPFVAEDA